MQTWLLLEKITLFKFITFNTMLSAQCNILLIYIIYVTQVDGSYAAVKFPTKEAIPDHIGAGTSKEDPSSLLQDCRLLRKDELTVCDTSSIPIFSYIFLAIKCAIINDDLIVVLSFERKKRNSFSCLL